MRISKFFATFCVAGAMAAQAFGIGSAGLAQAQLKVQVAPEAKVLAVLDIRGLDNLASAVEELMKGTPMEQEVNIRGLLSLGGMQFGLDPFEVFDAAAMQRAVAFKRGDDLGFAFVLAPEGGARGLNAALKDAWESVAIPEAAAKALPAGTTVYKVQGEQVFVMPYSPTQVVMLMASLRAGIRPTELSGMLQALPQQIAAEGQVALRFDADTWAQIVRESGELSEMIGVDQEMSLDALMELYDGLEMVSFGLGVKNGALMFDTMAKLAEGGKLAKQFEGMTGCVTREASALWLPGAIAARADHTYPGNSEAMNMARMALLDFCTHVMPEEEGSILANVWRTMFDLCEPFGPDYGAVLYKGEEGNELPMAFYASVADPSFKGEKARKYFAALPKRLFKLFGQLCEDAGFGTDRTDPLPVVFDFVETEKVDGVPVDTWNIVLTDCEDNRVFDRELPLTLASFKVAYLTNAIIIGDGGSDTDIGLTAILRRMRSPDAPLLAETAPFKEAMPIDATEALSVGYIQVFDVVRAVTAFVKRTSGDTTLEEWLDCLPESAGTVSYSFQQPQPRLLRQTLGISVEAVQGLIRSVGGAMGGGCAAAPSGACADDDDDWAPLFEE